MDPPLKSWIFGHQDVVAVEYHTSFPYRGDPFYLANVEHQEARRNRAAIFFVPSVRFDGPFEPPANNPTGYESRYGERKAIASRVVMVLNGDYDTGTRMGTLRATLAPELPLAGDWRLIVAITESDIDYEAPNGIDVHHHVFRSFAPGPNGTPVDLAAPGAEGVTVEIEFTLDATWNEARVQLVTFLEDGASREIEQVAGAAVLELVPVGTTTWGGIKILFRQPR